ncbi:MAG: Crp/Fnr family transcriptional regulator [Cytophagales bacterium]|nr:Crp/Fnr family transcriptional regulator [Cytophagales bacterium]
MKTKKLPGNELYDAFRMYDYLKASHPNLEQHVSTKVFKKGTYIYTPIQKIKHMYEVVEGAVKIGSHSEDGEEVVYDVLHKADFFGNLKYLNGQFYEFSKALVDTKVRLYDLSFFKSIIVHDPQVSDWFNYYLVKRWCIAEIKLLKMNSKSIAEKLDFLRDHFSKIIQDIHQNNYVLFGLLTKKDLGDLVGTTRQTVANALKKYEASLTIT